MTSSHETTQSLPVEILQQIVLYIPRQTLQTVLLVQPHPLGQIASHVFFSKLSLHFGVGYNYKGHHGLTKRAGGNPEFLHWHVKRSQEILMHIIENDRFASSVQTLKIYALASSGDPDMLRPETSTWECGTE